MEEIQEIIRWHLESPKTINAQETISVDILGFVHCIAKYYNTWYHCYDFMDDVINHNCRCLANLLAGLVAYQEEVGTKVVDGVLEDIRLGMEVNLPKFNQRRIAQVKYLGELYNYRMVESADVFKVR